MKIKVIKSYSSKDYAKKLKLFQLLMDIKWMLKLTKTPILPNLQVPNGFFWYKCKFYHSKIEK